MLVVEPLMVTGRGLRGHRGTGNKKPPSATGAGEGARRRKGLVLTQAPTRRQGTRPFQ